MPDAPLFGTGRVAAGAAGTGAQVTAEVQIPAVALFEHPEDATTLFEAVDSGAAGLTVTLREPLEYGQDTSDWSIVGEQRYQGVAAVNAQITGQSFAHASYAGEFATANLPDNTGLAGPTIAYDTDEDKFQYATAVIDWRDVAVADWVGIFGADPAYRPWQPAGGWGNDLGTAGAYEYADEAALEASLTANFAQWQGGIYDSTPNVLWFDQSDGDVKTFGAVTPPVEGVPADPTHVVVDAPNTRIIAYYNIAPGGALTEADTLGDLKGAFDIAAEGLSSEYVGGGDMDTAVTRPFANVSRFSQADLRGLRLMLTEPVARGEEGNDYAVVARARFPGGAEVQARQSHILIYTSTSRGNGVRIALDAGLEAPNEHGTLVDASSGALGNEWTFTVVDGDAVRSNVIAVVGSQREIIYYAPFSFEDVAASVLHDACNAQDGVSATYFGGQHGGAHPFDGSLGRINTLPQRFHGGQDYHAATANPEPIAVTRGPTHAHTRLYTTAAGGILLSLVDPAHDGGNGFSFEASEGALAFAVVLNEERIGLTIPAAGATAAAILAAANANDALEATYFGTEDGTTNVLPARFGRHEMLGGLDGREIEILYAPDATGGIANRDTLGAVKAVWDAIDGLISFYYGGADANTEASRDTPWEHEFENGDTRTINLSGFGLGPEQNEFVGANRAAAEAARDAYAAANPAWVEAYRGQAQVWIALRWGTDQVGQVLRQNASNPPVAGDWIDQNLALRGGTGPQGNDGSDADVKDFARIGGRQIAPADAESTFMLDSEFTAAAVRTLIGLTAAQLDDLVTGGSISGRTVTLTQADGSSITFMVPPDTNTQDGVLASGSIDAAGTELTLTLDTGVNIVVNIPDALRMGGGGGVTLAQIKEFARTGERGIRVGDIDSDGSADNTVITSDGANGAAWEAQQGPPAPPAGTHFRYFGWKAAGAIVTADLDASLARTNSSQTDEGEYPPNNVAATRWFAVPESEGVPTEHYLPPNPLNTIIGFARQAGTIDDGDGEAHIVMVAAAQTPITANPTDVRIGHN